MKVETLVKNIDSDFYTGVPDSQLKALCNYLMDRYGIDTNHHIIAANEGNCTAVAAGYHLATGKIPVVYMKLIAGHSLVENKSITKRFSKEQKGKLKKKLIWI